MKQSGNVSSKSEDQKCLNGGYEEQDCNCKKYRKCVN